MAKKISKQEFYELMDHVMSTSMAAKKWKCDPRQVRRYCEKDKVACVKIGHDYLIYKHQPNPFSAKKSQ